MRWLDNSSVSPSTSDLVDPEVIVAEGLEAWKKIDPALTIGNLTQAALAADLERVRSLQAGLDKLDAQLTDRRNQRDAALASLWDKVKRVRSGVKAIYGDDSSRYEMVGGTRKSEREKAMRKPKV